MKSRLHRIAAAAAVIMLGCPGPAGAHRLDEYLQAARFSVRGDMVNLEIDLTPGVAVASRISSLIDTNHDGVISSAESRQYAALVLRSIEIYVDGTSVPLTLASESFPELSAMNTGTGMIRLSATGRYPALAPGMHKLFYRNLHEPQISVYLANALVPEDKQIEITSQERDNAQHELTIDYRVVPAPGSHILLVLAIAAGGVLLTILYDRTSRHATG